MSDTVKELVRDDQVFGGWGDNSICTSITYDLSYLYCSWTKFATPKIKVWAPISLQSGVIVKLERTGYTPTQ